MKADVINVSKLLKRVDVQVPVSALKCGKDKMDELMKKALKEGDAPEVRYILGSFEATPATAKDSFVVHTVGTLRIAGKENTVKMDVQAERLPDGTLRATSEMPILMTDYGVKPPTALLGTLRTGNKVTVKFELLVGPRTMIAAKP
jgi:polyisoprenoid-binding protein YceI